MQRQAATLGLLLGALVFWVVPTFAQSSYPKSGKEYVVFIHCGPKSPDDPVVRAVAIALLQKGFLVREPEPDQDNVGGPGVDYFDESAAAVAADIANSVNAVLTKDPNVKPLVPRSKRLNNPAFYFGVWLFQS